MSAMSNYLETEFLKYFFRTAAMATARPSTWFVSLHTGSPGETGASNEVSTGGGTAYLRETMGTPAIGADTDGVATNANLITFDTPAAAWGTVTHFAIWDAVSAGNCLCYGALTSPSSIVVGIGVVVSFAAGSITITAT